VTDAANTRFMIDHMLVKLGKYLRILGYDAAWDLGLRTHELIARANAERRVFVTRNRRLAGRYGTPADLVVLEETDPVEQLRRLAALRGLDVASGLFSTCIRCNLRLEGVPGKRAIEDRVHPNVYRRFERFFLCPGCGTVFWQGSHVRNTCRKLGLPLV
jgi:uncharacterized protein